LFRVDELPDGKITIWWDDSESLVFNDQETFQKYCYSLTPHIKTMLRTLLLLDYSEQQISGKTASLSISDPDNIWVVAS
jgi:hypothetical protein